MKQCPQCNFSNEDTATACEKCGYLFSAQNFSSAPGGGAYQPPQPPFQQPYPPNSQTQNHQAPSYGGYKAYPAKTNTSGLAVAGMILGFVSYIFIILGIFNKFQIYHFRYFYNYISAADFIVILTAISGIILSIISMKKIGSKEQKGKGMALTGIIFSGAGLLVSLTIIKLLINIIKYRY
jgi:uncharacterized membrane protein